MITPSCDGQVYQQLQYSSVSIFSLNWLKSGLLLTDIALVSQSDSSMPWKLTWPGSLKFWQTSPPQCGVTTKE